MGTTLAAHADAVRRRGADGLAEALIARHNRRMANLDATARHFSPNAFAVLHPLLVMDTASWLLGQRVLKHPCDYGATWLEHLGWATERFDRHSLPTLRASHRCICRRPISA